MGRRRNRDRRRHSPAPCLPAGPGSRAAAPTGREAARAPGQERAAPGTELPAAGFRHFRQRATGMHRADPALSRPGAPPALSRPRAPWAGTMLRPVFGRAASGFQNHPVRPGSATTGARPRCWRPSRLAVNAPRLRRRLRPRLTPDPDPRPPCRLLARFSNLIGLDFWVSYSVASTPHSGNPEGLVCGAYCS